MSGKKKPKTAPEERPYVSSKTPQVMKLINGDPPVNPVVIAGKSRIPKQLRGIEPLSKVMRRDAEAMLAPDEEEPTVSVDLTQAAIKENVTETLRRFNACSCEKCAAALSAMVSEDAPARFAEIPMSGADDPAGSVPELYEPIKREVLSKMIRILMGNKKRSFH